MGLLFGMELEIGLNMKGRRIKETKNCNLKRKNFVGIFGS